RVTKPSAVISSNFISTAIFACSAFVTACDASDNCSVSNTPLLSASFISGDVTDVILSNLLCNTSLPVVPSGMVFNLFFADCLITFNPKISLSFSAASLGVTNPSSVISDNFVSTATFAFSTSAMLCEISNHLSVSNTSLLSASFTSGAVTVAMLCSRVFVSCCAIVPLGTLVIFACAVGFALSNVGINASPSAFSSGATDPSDDTSTNVVSTTVFACSAVT